MFLLNNDTAVNAGKCAKKSRMMKLYYDYIFHARIYNYNTLSLNYGFIVRGGPATKKTGQFGLFVEH